MNQSADLRGGYAAGVTAFALWGLLPVYWRALGTIPSDSVVAVRTLGSLPVVLILIWWMGRGARLKELLGQPRIVALHLLSALLLGVNWLVFILATHHGQILQASLGYFLTPLANVLIGALVLHERLRPVQWAAVVLAAAGVVIQVIAVGELPWIALSLVGTFAIYGLVRKLSPADSLQGLTLEGLWGAPLAAAWLWLHPVNWSAVPSSTAWLLALVGLVTVIPLLAFGSAARRIPMSHLGLLQFLAPSLQFISGWLCGENLTRMKLAGFAVIWAGCVLFIKDSLSALPRK